MNISPINPIDLQRFRILVEKINEHKHLRSELSPGSRPEIKIYTSGNYVSLEIRGFVPEDEIAEIFNNIDLNILKF